MYKKILVPLDGSELAECVLPHVAAIAGGCGVTSVTFLRVIEPYYLHAAMYAATGYGISLGLREEDIEKIDAENRSAAEKYLSEVVSRAKYKGAQVQGEVFMGKAAEGIVDYAAKNGCDLIIIATHGRSGLSRWVWGSVADRVLRSANVPVLMVRALAHAGEEPAPAPKKSKK